MTSDLPTVAFHIGAHKTATSHLQRCLLNGSEALADYGVHYFGPEVFRQNGQSIIARFGLRNPLTAQHTARQQLQAMANDGHRVVMSEENFIGPLNDPVGVGLTRRYPHAGEKVGMLADALGRPVDVFLGVRRPTDYLNSGYCQMLMGGMVRPFDEYKAANPLSSVDWPALVADLRGTKGVGQMTVWRQEDYMSVFPQIAARMVGADAADCVPQIPRRRNVGLSEDAVARLQREAPLQHAKRGFEVRAALPVDEDRPRFDGFAPDLHAQSAQDYEMQLQAIEGMDDVTVLRPD